MAGDIEFIPTPFGDGVIQRVNGKIMLVFAESPMGEEALQWVIEAGAADHDEMADVSHEAKPHY